MALNQADRLALSQKIVDIPTENAQSQTNKDQLNEAKSAEQQKDTANKNIMDGMTTLINGYSGELQAYSGRVYTQLLESQIQDAAKKVQDNGFFPNNNATPITWNALVYSGNIWKEIPPWAGGFALGNKFDGTFDTLTTEESSLIAQLTIDITSILAYSNSSRTTGIAAAHCSIPIYLDQPTCEANLGTWIPAGPDPVLQALGTTIIADVNAWKAKITATQSIIVTTDTDGTRSAQNTAAINDIINALAILNAWLALPDYDPAMLVTTKFSDAGLAPLQAEITARNSFIATRTGQLNTNLGTVTQNADGSILTATGLYGNRFRILDLRLNLMSGSLSKVQGLDAGMNAQDQAIASNANATAAYSTVLLVTKLRAPASGVKIVQVMDSTGFSVSDVVYVASSEADELTGTITAINGNAITLSFNVSINYRNDNGGRLYKVL